ncbi:MAG: RluA family pseudouridine synthase [Muribaculaceae bacterium]|nr:RluA family pseudouridine synthase [Muribaculaceae bacterium]
MAKQLRTKPGAERAPFRPDVILRFDVKQSDVECVSQAEAEDGQAESGLKLLDFLFASMPDRKRVTVKDYLKHNQIRVNGNVTRQFDDKLCQGDVVEVNTTREFQTLDSKRVSIVYEDEDILVVNKGYGLLSVSADSKKQHETAYSILRDYLKRVDPRQKLFIVHRLDQHTSGLMMFAKSVAAKETMQHNWNNMVLERRYVAVVEGRPDPASGVVDSLLAENSEHVVYSTNDATVGKRAVTDYRTLRSGQGYSLVELSLSTGRKNQIRVHMHDLGCPIAGDRKYGAKSSPIHRVALHARTLRFVHPVTRRDMNFSTAVPAAFSKCVGGYKG